MPNCLQTARTHNKPDWQSYQPENRDDGTNLLPRGHSAFLLTNHNNQHRYNNCSGDKSNSTTLISLAAIPDKDNVHAAGDASNSLIQASIARLALSIFSCVGIPWITLESAIPTLARASSTAPPLDMI
jgi:hypothetical protein